MVTDAQRLELYTGLVEALGSERADIMMQLVPGAGWADVARRADIDSLRTEVDGKLARLEGRMYAALAAQTIALAGLVIAVAKLA